MGNVFGEAGVQYGDWKGTASLDDPDEFNALYDLAGISHDEFDIVGWEAGGSYDFTYAYIYVIDAGLIKEFEDWGRIARENNGLIPVRRIELDAENDRIALDFLAKFKRWEVHATMRHAIADQGFDLRIDQD